MSSSSASPAGDGDGDRLMERVEPFGQDMARPHQVALAASTARLDDATAAISSLEHDIVHRVGDRDILASTKDALIVVLAPASPACPDHEARNAFGQGRTPDRQ